MPNKNYQRGRRFEWQVKKDLEALGWMVARTAGSHGVFDLWALKEDETGGQVFLIQCKVTKTENTVKSLINDFENNIPFKSSFSQGLAIKITGQGGYILHMHKPRSVTDE